jgi:hypothetical protein
MIKKEFETAASPIARLIGHSLASAFGFCSLTVVSLIPIVVIRLLINAGFDQLAEPLHSLEMLLLIVDIVLFMVVFLSGVVVFAVETLATARDQISEAWRKVDHGHS